MYLTHDGSVAYLKAGGAENGLAFQVGNSASGTYGGQTYTDVMRLLQNGNVGIGTISPGARLAVADNAPNNGVFKLGTTSGNANDTWWMGFVHGASSTTSTTQDGNDRGRIGINIASSGAGRLFFTTGGGNSQVERMRIDETGNVGIGTTTPNMKLTIQPLAGNADLIQFKDNAGTNQWHLRTQGSGNNDLGFTESTIADNRLVLEAGGNVGINIADPTNTLDVNGYVKLGTSGGANVEGSIRYNSTKKCIEVYDGWRWKCQGVPDVEEIVFYDGYNETNNTSTWIGSYGPSLRSGNLTAVYPGQKIVITVFIWVDNAWKQNSGFGHAYKLYTNGYGFIRENVNTLPNLQANEDYLFMDKMEYTIPAGHPAGNNFQLNFEYQGNFRYAKVVCEKY